MWYVRQIYSGAVVSLPSETYREVDDNGWEVRRVDFWRDGTVGYADRRSYIGETELSERPMVRAASDAGTWTAAESSVRSEASDEFQNG